MAYGLPDFGTFFPLLAACVSRTTGPVLELGAGDHSTPMLHFMCKHEGRKLITAETDAKWLAKYTNYVSAFHEIHLVEKWDQWTRLEEMGYWSVALVDNAPGDTRLSLIKRLKGRCQYIVIHDTEKDENVGTDYKYEEIIPSFKYVYEWKRYRPYTTVVSDDHPFDDLEDATWRDLR
jgi:hypothetical protein